MQPFFWDTVRELQFGGDGLVANLPRFWAFLSGHSWPLESQLDPNPEYILSSVTLLPTVPSERERWFLPPAPHHSKMFLSHTVQQIRIYWTWRPENCILILDLLLPLVLWFKTSFSEPHIPLENLFTELFWVSNEIMYPSFRSKKYLYFSNS